ncbi:Phosphomannomutase/phosphoglucomutase [Desulfamplus magnetovallimortis]|uniref:Phosphomannomutase/phosphoglucomutase n=1 Tax=Desulfamplus magnetovallimortis TaxID=1246637 RepID=A0A1W1HB71_9BACT|nr:phosphomannomutase/phosphoglucomutase [Desulfamplus magnetovallimortis]SLM29730.1 Phosphomannomutase/phosphoglucomutase [Desulfamplus magnetovallimortis]
MNPGIFREYDIRGVAGKDLVLDDVVSIGKSYGTMLAQQGKTKVTVGRDCRVTSDEYSKAFIDGILSTGCDVIDIGVCPTPVLYFSIHHCKSDGGAMVTASHNPPEYNGFKLMSGYDSIHSTGLQEIRKIIDRGEYVSGDGTLSSVDVLTPYKAYLEENISLTKPVRIGIDAGNGTGGITALPLLKALGCEVHDLYCDLDGTFPNHEADPTVKANLEELIALVKEKRLELGVGYDGDGDRIGVVDENGNVIYGDQLMIIYAREILSRKPGATFISEVKCSMTMYNDIEAHGGRAIMWKTGHSLIKKKMKEENAALAGEMSGHIFFSDRYLGYDDALYATCRLLEIMANTGKKVSELIEDLPKTFTTPEIRVECSDSIKFDVVKRIVRRFKETNEVIDIDGMRALFDGGWGLVRASNTQPALVLRFEAATEDRLNEIRSEVETALKEIISSVS